MSSGLEERLKKALAGRSPAEMNEFQFLNLEMVKVETGDRWIEVRKKIYSVATHFVEKRVHPDDVVVRCRGGFILIFAHLSAEESRARLEVLSQELNVFFLGDQILKDLDINASARKVNAAEFAQFIQMSAQADPGEAVSGGRRRTAEQPAAPSGRDRKLARNGKQGRAPALGRDAGSPVPESVARWVEGQSASSASSSGLQAEPRTVPRPVGRWQEAPVSNSGQPEYTGAMVPGRDKARAPARLAYSAADAAANVMSEPALLEPVPVDITQLWDDIIFKPCWDATHNAICSNICLARRFKDGAVSYGRDTLMGSRAPELHSALDIAVAIAAQRGFQRGYARGDSCDICIPVHYDTIRTVADRVNYFSILQVVPPHLRRHFFLRVDHIPHDAPLAQMQDMFRSMKWFGSNLLATVPFDQTDLSRFEGCGIDIFGADIPAAIRAGGISDEHIELLGRRTKAASQQGAGTALSQVDSFEALVAGISVGVRGFAGDAIGTDAALPIPNQALSFVALRQRAEDMRDFDCELLGYGS
ncbi:hypothetical protein [Maricaulis salignorans]|uniref:GGDEF domain-containing protein, diguanylate cyclase (C-di-GMP synthetase) or its enzymatically inactive variants n=1 Tax=Maricaulis salignorans TaxID=144026 RepID=A0A1G9LJI2_9PROT|nr:hypothetical protein [Maricaulis salignorans]SDL62109.1 hypothetical protein SAMN04488568_10182 [Maricaulis salignorans]